jgi:hypothetical protein
MTALGQECSPSRESHCPELTYQFFHTLFMVMLLLNLLFLLILPPFLLYMSRLISVMIVLFLLSYKSMGFAMVPHLHPRLVVLASPRSRCTSRPGTSGASP